jgi:hypothetical protein
MLMGLDARCARARRIQEKCNCKTRITRNHEIEKKDFDQTLSGILV